MEFGFPNSKGISWSCMPFESGYASANYPVALIILMSSLISGESMYVYVTRNIVARMRSGDGTDNGCYPLNPGKYQANKTNDGALEILREADEPVYLLPFIWWEKMEIGDILIAA
jgi:hypothetical protein